jgi:hypothetical protein
MQGYTTQRDYRAVIAKYCRLNMDLTRHIKRTKWAEVVAWATSAIACVTFAAAVVLALHTWRILEELGR